MFKSGWHKSWLESHKVGFVCCLLCINIIQFFIPRSIGRTLRSLAESEPKPLTENFAIKEAITAGEMVSKESLDKLLHTNALQLLNKKGIIIDGYPRDMSQIHDFQEKVSPMDKNNWCFDHKHLFFHFIVQPNSAHRSPRLFQASTWPWSIR